MPIESRQQKTMINNIHKKERLLFGVGLLIVLTAMLPYLILGEDMVVFYPDQLDGEVLGYILHAKYLFTGIDTYPEMMNGISENGLFPPAPLLVLLYKILCPSAAFVCNQIFCMVIAYIGMYFCIKTVLDIQEHHQRYCCEAVFCGILFAYLPLLSVYGLCQYGLPLLCYNFYLLYKGKYKILALCGVVFYGLMSSLVLIGYSVLGFGVLFLLWLVWKKQVLRHKWFLIGWLSLLCAYLLTNYKLLLQIFGIGSQEPSHKEVIVRYGQNVIAAFRAVFYEGTLHTPTHHKAIVIITIVVLVLGICGYRRLQGQLRRIFCLLAAGFGFNLFCALFYAFYQSDFIADWRNQAGGIIKEFQVDRIYWLTVFVWYFLLGLDLYLIWEWIKCCVRERKIVCIIAGSVFLSGVVFVSAATVYYYSDFSKNLHRLRQGESYARVTWNDFYAPEIFSQIDSFIGREKSSYRTLSFGIYPAIALYNGFYCLDGYSNNYNLAYLYTFREIIEGELEKAESLQKYYDEWGCRCYILSAELGINNYLVHKSASSKEIDLVLNTDAARKMGAQYLFSAVKIANAEKLGLTLLREKPFETSDSYYAVYLYGLGTA